MNNNKKHKQVSTLVPGDVFINTATRYTVLSMRVAEMSHPTNQKYMLVETDKGSLKIPAMIAVPVV